jgi:hypothetical protein
MQWRLCRGFVALVVCATACTDAREEPVADAAATGEKDGPASVISGSGDGAPPAGNDGGSGCVAASPCVLPAMPCLMGTTDCTGGVATCLAGDKRQANGTPCGNDSVCLEGACSPCTAGQSCPLPGKPCRVGVIDCTAGKPACMEMGSAPAGTSCGTGMVCKDGNCAACTAADPCVPANPCHQGALDCTGGTSRCVDNGMLVAAGGACGADKVCGPDGSCVACSAGKACDPTDPCKGGKLDCSSGAARCGEVGNAPNGKACGAGKVCNAGMCVVCNGGTDCTPANRCHRGALSCTAGTADCVDSGNNAANGSPCGEGMVCNNGACGACKEGASCTTGTPCKTATISCATGAPRCLDSGNAPNGSSQGCAAGKVEVCKDGACVPCSEGMGCAPALCRQGTITCASGVSSCKDSGATDKDGTPCGAPDHVCKGGACVACQAGSGCSSANPCKMGGTTSCATGSSVCMESNRPDGTGCGDTTCTGSTRTVKQCTAGRCTDVSSSCAPAACNAAHTDCALCGNQRVDPGETCDPCSTACTSDRDTVRTPSGDASKCTFRCDSAPRACGPADGQCPSGCGSDSGDPDCKLATGAGCGANGQCKTGFCVDGHCCDSACSGGCQACAGTATGQADGRCASVKAGADPRDDCADQGGCGNDGSCDGAGGCRFYPTSKICVAAACGSDTSERLEARCDGRGGCPQPTFQTCGFGERCMAPDTRCTVVCGQDGTPCCDGPVGCAGPLVCLATLVGPRCQPCGGLHQQCCPPRVCNGTGIACAPNGVAPSTCEVCGGPGQPCCDDEPQQCNDGRACTTCGGIGLPCCPS